MNMLRFCGSLAVLVAVIAAVANTYCEKRSTQYERSTHGWDKCDENGLACCYYFNGSVILYSHNYHNGTYNPNTHCEYIIDIDWDCNLVMCVEIDMSLAQGSGVMIKTMDTSITYKGTKTPFNANLNDNSASVMFTSEDGGGEDNKWSMGMVCVPKTDYRSVCEICEDIVDQQLAGPEGDEVFKFIED